MTNKVTVYTDGSSLGNPGPGGYGIILRTLDSEGRVIEKELSEGFDSTTNNRMELMGVIVALESLRFSCEVDIYSDSKYVVDAFNQKWIDSWRKRGWVRGKNKPVKNVDLWERLLKAKEPHEVRFHWVKGHDGNPENERCDFLATSAAGKAERRNAEQSLSDIVSDAQ